jgi:hypothetical protein
MPQHSEPLVEGPTPVTAEEMNEALKQLAARIPHYTHLTQAEAIAMRKAATLDEEWVRSAIGAIGESPAIPLAVGQPHSPPPHRPHRPAGLRHRPAAHPQARAQCPDPPRRPPQTAQPPRPSQKESRPAARRGRRDEDHGMKWLRVFAFAAVALIAATQAGACSCGPKASPQTVFWKTALIFEGTVVAIEDRYGVGRQVLDDLLSIVGRSPAGSLGDDYERRYGFTITFNATRVWRQSTKRRFNILTARGGGDCGYKFQVGKTYLVYAHCDPSGTCYTGICSRTRAITDAAEDLRYLATQPVAPFRE